MTPSAAWRSPSQSGRTDRRPPPTRPTEPATHGWSWHALPLGHHPHSAPCTTRQIPAQTCSPPAGNPPRPPVSPTSSDPQMRTERSSRLQTSGPQSDSGTFWRDALHCRVSSDWTPTERPNVVVAVPGLTLTRSLYSQRFQDNPGAAASAAHAILIGPHFWLWLDWICPTVLAPLRCMPR